MTFSKTLPSREGRTVTITRGWRGKRTVKIDVPNGASRTMHYRIRLPNNHSGHLSLQSAVGRNASIAWFIEILGYGSPTISLLSTISGRGGKSNIRVSIDARRGARVHLKTESTFLAPEGGGDTIMRIVAQRGAEVRAEGGLTIVRRAQKTVAHLEQSALLLHPSAQVSLTPTLSVAASDVTCKHSASARKLHPEDLLYLAARGIGFKKAQKMLVEGFLCR